MRKTLVTVAHKAEARFFALEPGEPLEPIARLEHPASRARNQDLVTDGPGAVKERMGPQVRAAQPEVSPKEKEAERFAREVADRLREYRLSDDYRWGVVVAAPAFMGLLRDALDAPDRDFVEVELTKNLADAEPDAIREHLGEVITV